MRHRHAGFISAEVGSLAGETIVHVWQHDAGVDSD
jgi:hypothetical protein